MIKKIITEHKRRPIYGDRIGVSNEDWYMPYVGSILHVKLFGLIWVRYKKVLLIGKNN
jgi:hypothetical protein